LPTIGSDTYGTLFMFKNSLLAFALCGIVAAGPCMAHAKLQSSSPADNAHLTEAPKTLTLNFNEAAQLAVLKLVRDGKEIPVPHDKSAKAGQTFTLTLPALSPGKYTVQWAAVAADDGHVTKGSFAFSIAA
jgi:methionine-rich copper-binding protein CopC